MVVEDGEGGQWTESCLFTHSMQLEDLPMIDPFSSLDRYHTRVDMPVPWMVSDVRTAPETSVAWGVSSPSSASAAEARKTATVVSVSTDQVERNHWNILEPIRCTQTQNQAPRYPHVIGV